jgi:hypothetical protein
MRCISSSFFFFFLFFATSQFGWPITQKEMKLWRLPKIEGLVLFWNLEFLPLWPTYIIALFHHVRWPFSNLIKQFNLSIWTLFHLLWIKQRENCFNVLGRQVIKRNLSSTKKNKGSLKNTEHALQQTFHL